MMNNFENLITNIKVGDSFSNYRRLCDYLELPIASGNAKIAQMKKIGEYVDFRKDGNALIVTSVHSRVLHEDKRKIGKISANRKQFDQYKIPMEYDHCTGVYAIKLENKIYIGSTTDFRKRFLVHKYGIKNFEYTKKLLDNGATFEILYLAPHSISQQELLDKEQEIIDSYLSQSNIKVMNKGLIVYGSSKSKKIRKRIEQQSCQIWVTKSNYKQAVQLLKENGLIA